MQIRIAAYCFSFLLISAASFNISQAAAPGGISPDIEARLDSFEFGPALELAAEIEDPSARNAAFARIAQYQNSAGASYAARATARAISDDRVRSEAVGGFGSVSGGNAGGGSNADFDSLMELIETTIAPDSWETVGGRGAMAPFPTGVYVDPFGVLRTQSRVKDRSLAALRETASREAGESKSRRVSSLRKVSLTRLEREAQLRLATGQRIDDEMLGLAGIERVQYIFVYPETGDLVIAGPAGDWRTDEQGRQVNVASGRPLPRMDDLVVLLRTVDAQPDPRFGCSITPTTEAIARTQKFLDSWSGKAVPAGGRAKWLKELQSQLGRQTVAINGIDPTTRTAAILVEADRHMKLVGIGLEDGVPGVTNYLSLAARAGGKAKAMNVLRWWFTLDYDGIETNDERSVFALRGRGVRVLSENELLTKTGERVHPGTSDELTAMFAQQFTNHFDELAAKYPIYAELQNIFDLSMVAAIIRANGLADHVSWHATSFGRHGDFPIQRGPVPREVDTVLNHRMVGGRTILAAISGGVDVYPLVKAQPKALRISTEGGLDSTQGRSAPRKLAPEQWWWD